MKKYRVKIYSDNKSKIIEADSELEARLKFCQERDFNYRVYANKLEVSEIKN